ncbi:Uncharacterised protein [uncultured archaeon]|nr:Uncharacterised protein [uncultured archaeon]
MLKALMEAADILAARTTGKTGLGMPDFADKRYVSKPFSASNFRPIERAENSSSKIAFIDAGNFELLRASNFSVHLIRGYFSVFQKNQRVAPRVLSSKAEFFSVSLASASANGIGYECALIPVSESSHAHLLPKTFSFDYFDESLAARQNFRASISVIGSAVRRYLEWSIASEVIEKELGSGDILLRDGTLEASVCGEELYAKKAFDAAKRKNVSLCALAKTCALLTTTGFPLVSAVNELSKQNKISAPWLYHPLCENKNHVHDAEIFVCNLHKNSSRAFRFEADKSLAKIHGTIDSVLSQTAKNSCDASFLGYPYGLIDADASSRISFKEAGNYRAMLSSVLQNKGALDSIQKLSDSIDAHDVLNEIIL